VAKARAAIGLRKTTCIPAGAIAPPYGQLVDMSRLPRRWPTCSRSPARGLRPVATARKLRCGVAMRRARATRSRILLSTPRRIPRRLRRGAA
jgi:hypothetical protein